MGRLESVAEGLWVAEGPVVNFYGFPYRTRMVVVRLPDQSLWVWSSICVCRGGAERRLADKCSV